MRRIGALDGLRGIAVLLVMVFHAFPVISGGFLGVDVFFVLSGFLITSLLLRERARTGAVDFQSFYRRRIARLAPAYLVLLAIAVPLMLGPLSGEGHWPVAAAVAVGLLYVANWANVADVDALGPLNHTWSLSIEEQFYVVWPLAFVALSRRRRSPVPWLVGGIALVTVARAVGWEVTAGIWPYFSTFTHADGLLAGALLAVLLERADEPAAQRWADLARRWSAALAAVGAVALAGLLVLLAVPRGVTYLGGLSLATAATVAIVGHVVLHPQGRVGRALQFRPLVEVGRVSYGLYLFHVPVFQYVQSSHVPGVVALAIEGVVPTVLAIASWHAIERHALDWSHGRGRRGRHALRRFALRTGPLEIRPRPSGAVVQGAGPRSPYAGVAVPAVGGPSPYADLAPFPHGPFAVGGASPMIGRPSPGRAPQVLDLTSPAGRRPSPYDEAWPPGRGERLGVSPRSSGVAACAVG